MLSRRDDTMEKRENSGCKKWTTMFGISLLLPSSGLALFWSNISVYTVSFVVVRDDSSWGVTSPWILQAFGLFLNVGCFLAGLLSTVISKRAIVLIGIACSTLAYVMAYFTVQESILAMTFTFGITCGMSSGLLTGVCLQYAVHWADEKPGLYTAIVRGVIAISSIPVNQFVTMYHNPSNTSPDLDFRGSRFFSQNQILDRVPYSYLILGCAFLVFQIFGFFMLQERKSLPVHEERQASYNSTATGPGDKATRNQRHPPTHGPDRSLQTDNMPPTTDFTTREMVRTKDFYVLMVSTILGIYPFIVRSKYFKIYGELFVKDDFALTILVNVVCAGIVFTGTFMGFAIDRYGSKVCLIGYHGCVSVLNWMFYFSPMVHPWVYYVTTFVIGSVNAPFLIVHTGVVVHLFGRKHFTMNLGLLLFFPYLIALIGTPIIGVILDCGWFHLYAFSATLSLIAVFVVTSLSTK